jgi:hypothetical protein
MWMAWKESNGAVLAEHGMDVPEGINVNVVENTDNTVHVTLPAAPDAHADLSDEELESAAGGTIIWKLYDDGFFSSLFHC